MFVLVSAGLGVPAGHFDIKNWMERGFMPNLVYFVFTLGVSAITLICHFAARKYSTATELIIPLYCFFITLALSPIWSDDFYVPKYFKSITLEQTNNQLYIFNFMIAVMLTSHYSLSVAGRLLLAGNNINTIARRVTSGNSPIVPLLMNFAFIIGTIEMCCFTISQQRVHLFLEKERILRQQQQTESILQNMPANVMVVGNLKNNMTDVKVVFKNKQAEKLLSTSTAELCSPEDRKRSDFSEAREFLNKQIFKFKVQKNSPYPVLTRRAMEQHENRKMEVSIRDILRSDQILLHTNEFTLKTETKRVFQISKQRVELGAESCFMVFLQEVTVSH